MLTDSKVRSAKPLAKSYKLTDSQGLYLTVSTSGAKLWYFRYRFGGKENRLAFGPYPQTTLAEAREKRDAARNDEGQTEGKLHVWSPYGQGEAVDLLPGFNGERADPVSGTYHLGNGYRAYNPVLMRFNCPDSLSPFGAGGINPYAYCAGDPVNHTDPSGHLSWQGITGIVAGAIGILLAGFTAGASIAAAGGVMAAVSTASATSLVIGGLSVAADVTGIVSGALEDADPEASSVLGWVSMGAGIAGLAGGVSLMPKGIKALKRRKMPIEATNVVVTRRISSETYSFSKLDKGWHEEIVNGKSIFAANRPINQFDYYTPLEIMAKRGSIRKRPINILAGSHGTSGGSNWSINELNNTFMIKSNLLDENILNEAKIIFGSDELFNYHKNLSPLKGRLRFIDAKNLNAELFEGIVLDCNHLILTQCYGRNDILLRSFAGLELVQEYGHLT